MELDREARNKTRNQPVRHHEHEKQNDKSRANQFFSSLLGLEEPLLDDLSYQPGIRQAKPYTTGTRKTSLSSTSRSYTFLSVRNATIRGLRSALLVINVIPLFRQAFCPTFYCAGEA